MERDVEDAILRELEPFFWNSGPDSRLSLGRSGFNSTETIFTSISCSTTGNSNAWPRSSLSKGNFKPEYKGQMELYLRLAKCEREEDEALPLGIILCAGKNTEQIELLELSAQEYT